MLFLKSLGYDSMEEYHDSTSTFVGQLRTDDLRIVRRA